MTKRIAGLTCLIVLAGSAPVPRAAQRAPDTDAIVQTAFLLASPWPEQVEEGRARLDRSRGAIYAALAARLQTGSVEERERTARLLTIVVSPWMQARYAGWRSSTFATPMIRRPIGRPFRQPEVAVVRRAALAALESALSSGGGSAQRTYAWDLCLLLGAVGDDTTARRVEARERDDMIADSILYALDIIYGLPSRASLPFSEDRMAPPDDLARFDRFAHETFVRTRAPRIAWYQRYHDVPLEERLKAAVEEWNERRWAQSSEESGYDLGVARLDQLLWQGEAVVPVLEAFRRRANAHARFHCDEAIAAITGRIDDAYVSRLLKGSSREREMGVALIMASASRNHLDELEALLRGYVQGENPRDHRREAHHVLEALFACHFVDGLPALRRVSRHPSREADFESVDYLIRALEEPRASTPSSWWPGSIAWVID